MTPFTFPFCKYPTGVRGCETPAAVPFAGGASC